ncbi:hypothetical protein TSUKUMMB_49270 [Rhodococcus sp. no. 34]
MLFESNAVLCVAGRVRDDRVSRGAGQQDTALLESFPHRSQDESLRPSNIRAEPLGPPLDRRPGPLDLGRRIGLVDAASGEDRHAPGKRHPLYSLKQEDLDTGFGIAHQDDGRRILGLGDSVCILVSHASRTYAICDLGRISGPTEAHAR